MLGALVLFTTATHVVATTTPEPAMGPSVPAPEAVLGPPLPEPAPPYGNSPACLSYPLSGATTDSIVEFSWTRAGNVSPGDTVWYNLSLATDPSFESPTFQLTTTDTSFTSPPLAKHERYFWQVVSHGPSNPPQGVSSIPWFATNGKDDIPSPPRLTAPLSTSRSAAREVQFAWEASIDPDWGDSVYYELKVARIRCPGRPIRSSILKMLLPMGSRIVVRTIATNRATVYLEEDKCYSWEVEAHGEKNIIIPSGNGPYWFAVSQ